MIYICAQKHTFLSLPGPQRGTHNGGIQASNPLGFCCWMDTCDGKMEEFSPILFSNFLSKFRLKSEQPKIEKKVNDFLSIDWLIAIYSKHVLK